jgi:hypothetical protein
MSDEWGARRAQTIADDGDMAWELRQRARGYGQPFRAILEKAATLVVNPVAPIKVKEL